MSAPAFIPLCEPALLGNEWTYVRECLDSGWVSSVGAFVDRFERVLADAVGAKYGVATVNGTAALHTALLVAGVEPEDEVLVSTLTFIAPANAVRYLGAWPVFVDAEPGSWQMDPARVLAFLRRGCVRRDGALRNRLTGRRVRAVLPVHILGHPVDLDPILECAREFDLAVVEDATESLGATYKGRPVGRLGDIACFSFNGNKLITTGGGGMIVTDRPDWAARAKYLTTQAKDDPVEYVHHAVGYNYRLTNVQAAMGVAQMERLDHCISAKRRIAARYAEALGELPGITPMSSESWAGSVYWLYTILVDRTAAGLESRELLAALAQRMVQTRPLWQPLHRSLAHARSQALGGDVADQLHRDGLSLPCSVGLQPEQQERVIRELVQLVHAAAPKPRRAAAGSGRRSS